eukprot:22629_1
MHSEVELENMSGSALNTTKSAGLLTIPLINDSSQFEMNSKRSSSRSFRGPLQKGVNMKHAFQNKKENLTLDQLAHDERYRVYYIIFGKIRWLLIILGLWAPPDKGCLYWCLRNVYPACIYFFILYPWTTFLTQEAYWSVPVFLFVNLHLSSVFAYRAARQYWNSKANHLITFLTSTFIPFYQDIQQFEQNYSNRSNYSLTDVASVSHATRQQSLHMGFQQRYKQANRKRHRKAFGIGLEADLAAIKIHKTPPKKEKKEKSVRQEAQLEILEDIRRNTSDPFKQKEENISSWSEIAGSENKLSLTLFYEATQRLWRRFWITTCLTVVPIVVILLAEIVSPNLHSSIDMHARFNSQLLVDIFVPFNTFIIFTRIFYMCEFVFMAFYFQFICECHRGDLLIHLHYYDTSDIDEQQHKHCSYGSLLSYYNALEYRLASIIWDWDRIASSIRETSRAFRWWIFVMVMFNVIAGVTAVVNLSTKSSFHVPQHLEMYMPAVVNLLVSFYVLFSGTKVSHMNKAVRRRTYFLLATTHFTHVQVDVDQDTKSHSDELHTQQTMDLQIRKQNLYIQAQTVAQAATARQIGISVYGMVLNRNLFLAFFSPFVAFFLFCINTWLPSAD